MRNSITIYGAKSLDRYTKLILKNGFQNNSWKVVDGVIGQKSHLNTNAVIYQIHGAPQAIEEDKKIMTMIEETLPKGKIAVLLHRPDEIQESLPGFKKILLKLPPNIDLVFLGDKHINDPFYRSVDKRFVVPHGFFDVKGVIQKDPIVIGSHTTWGEMRSIEHALRLIIEVFRLNKNKSRNIVGYLGGKPKDQLQISHLKRICEGIFTRNEIEFIDAHEYSLSKVIRDFTKQQHVILVDSVNAEPDDFGITFNIQMYYFGSKVRTGESSGSLHASISIPVILEMNGSETIEDLRVIRVPYVSVDDIQTINFTSGSKKIIHAIDDGTFLAMLEHNLQQTKKFDNTFVARSYINIFEQL